MSITLYFESIEELKPEPLEFVIARIKGGETMPGYMNYSGQWYGAEGESISGVTHWADFPFINIKK